MSGRDRRDRDRRPGERRDSQQDDEQPRHSGEVDLQEGESLTALKAILAKVAALLVPLQLTQDECISLVEQLYGSVLDTDVRLAGETDDRRKASMLAHIQNTNVTRSGGKIVVEHPSADKLKADSATAPAPAPAPKDAATEPVATPAAAVAAESAPAARAAAEPVAPVAPAPVAVRAAAEPVVAAPVEAPVVAEPVQLAMTEPVVAPYAAPEPAASETVDAPETSTDA